METFKRRMLWWGAQEPRGSPGAPGSPGVWGAVCFCTSGLTVGSSGIECAEPVSPRALPQSGFPSWLHPSLTSLGPNAHSAPGPCPECPVHQAAWTPPTLLDPCSTHRRPPAPVSVPDWPLQGGWALAKVGIPLSGLAPNPEACRWASRPCGLALVTEWLNPRPVCPPAATPSSLCSLVLCT